MSNENQALDWDSEISNDNSGGGFVILPEGEYPFRVVKMERKNYTPSQGSKIGACKMATLTIEVDGGQLGTATVTENLHLWATMEWKLCEFFRAIGGRKHGERVRMDWSIVVGSEGRLKIGVRKYVGKDGTDKQVNQVVKFLDPEQKSAIPDSDVPAGW